MSDEDNGQQKAVNALVAAFFEAARKTMDDITDEQERREFTQGIAEMIHAPSLDVYLILTRQATYKGEETH